MKLFSIICYVLALYTFYQSIRCFYTHSKTKNDILKQGGIGVLISSVGIFLAGLATANILPIQSYITWFCVFIISFVGNRILEKARSRQPNYKAPEDGPRRPLILNIIIILTSIFLALMVFLAISLESRHDLLIKKGRTISGIVLDNDKQSSSDIIYYQFNDNGKWIRKSVSVKGVFQGKNVDDFKKGDTIEILTYNGQSLEKGYYEQHIQQNILFIIGFAVIFVWQLRRRLSLLEVKF